VTWVSVPRSDHFGQHGEQKKKRTVVPKVSFKHSEHYGGKICFSLSSFFIIAVHSFLSLLSVLTFIHNSTHFATWYQLWTPWVHTRLLSVPLVSILTVLHCMWQAGWGGHWGLCVSVLLIFLCGIWVNKIPPLGIAVNSNPTVYDICVFKPTVFSETKLFAVLQFLVWLFQN